ncbi:hypothetical protein ABW20_dc0105346 [Dactylellina cionopaga]|nr:hypothetical protein ABW20_dc0105346 [Dactylellina cionopaga]
MQYSFWFKVALFAQFPFHVVAPPPAVPEFEHFVYEIEGEAVVDNQKTYVSIDGWDTQKRHTAPQPCYPLEDEQTLSSYVFTNVRRLAINTVVWGEDDMDEKIIWEFYQDADCRLENHPRLLVKRGVYTWREGAKTQIGSFRQIDPLLLNFDNDSLLKKVHPAERQFVKTEDVWKKSIDQYKILRDDLISGNSEKPCAICHLPLAGQRPSKTYVTDCNHSYHGKCLGRWVATRNANHDPVEFEQRTGFPLTRVADCPECRKMFNYRKIARIPTYRIDEVQPEGQIRSGFGTPERRPNVNDQGSPENGLPSLLNTPGSVLDDLLNNHYMDERAWGNSRIRNPSAEYNFETTYLDRNVNPLVEPEDFGWSEVRETDYNTYGSHIRFDMENKPYIPETDYQINAAENFEVDERIAPSVEGQQLGPIIRTKHTSLG